MDRIGDRRGHQILPGGPQSDHIDLDPAFAAMADNRIDHRLNFRNRGRPVVEREEDLGARRQRLDLVEDTFNDRRRNLAAFKVQHHRTEHRYPDKEENPAAVERTELLKDRHELLRVRSEMAALDAQDHAKRE